ncbi:unnamed protein product, partial [marine sediment metagenome]
MVRQSKNYQEAVKLLERTSKIVIGYGLDEAVQMGPLHDKE